MAIERSDGAIGWRAGEPFSDLAPSTRGWRVLALAAAAVAWLLPSGLVWLMGLVGLVGWSGEEESSPGLLEHPSAGSVAAVGLAGAVIVIVTVAFVRLARWALPGRRRAATVTGVASAVWVPIALSLGAIWLVS